MPLGRTIFTVKVGGKDRVLFSILEKPSGELIIPIRHSERSGTSYATGIPVLEQRYSIHPSQRSTEFTTIKHTTNLTDGKQIVHVALTDAVKLKTGFSMLFVRRSSNLSPDKYLLSEKDRNRSLVFSQPDYDPAQYTLFYAVILGSPDFEFKLAMPHPFVRVDQHQFKIFRVIILSGRFSIPSINSSEMMQILTYAPESYADVADQLAMRNAMRGKPVGACLFQFTNSVHVLAKRCLEYALASGELDDPEIINRVQEALAHISKRIIPLAVDIRQQSDHTQTGAKPPSLRSPSPPREDDQ